jgi:4-hydroxybenzoate polyprenyltransferase
LGSAGPWLRLLRLEEYGPLFALCPLAGFLLAGGSWLSGLVALVISITTFSASAFVINDVMDAAQDAAKAGPRNPVATREIDGRRALALFWLLAAAAAATLLVLPQQTVYLALVAFGLYWGYSWEPGFRKMPVLDVVVHGTVPALYLLMGYSLARPVTAGAVALSLVVFFFAAATCVLQEIRDIGPDSLFRRTTVSLVGAEGGASLALLLSLAGTVSYVLCAVYGVLPLPMVVFSAAAPLLLWPVFSLMSGRMSAPDAIVRLRRLGTALAVAMMAVFVLLG